jgi:hypothetical protein
VKLIEFDAQFEQLKRLASAMTLRGFRFAIRVNATTIVVPHCEQQSGVVG